VGSIETTEVLVVIIIGDAIGNHTLQSGS